jgi:hypothetical protein
MAEAVEHLPSKSNSSTTKKIRKKE